MSTSRVGEIRLGSGVTLSLIAAASFGMSGPFVATLLEAGWSPSAAVLWRTAGAAVVLVIPAILALRGRWALLRRNAGMILAYGIFAVLACQLAFYSAIEHMSVSIAILIEYLSPVFLVLFFWARSRRHPGAFTIVGAIVALVGLVLVLNLTGDVTPSMIGVAWALLASFGSCIYYVISARADKELPPIVLAAGAMIVASIALVLLAVVGLTPLRATFGEVAFLGTSVSWLVPAAVILGMSTIAGYLLGIAGASRLGSRLASFLGLTEVLFAVIIAWLLLGEIPVAIQFVGGALILTGVVLVRVHKERASESDSPLALTETTDALQRLG
ncbi:EamA family transporter [Glaciibacter psychrotolerans]|uniref:Drug/metabolite transporter (DMT)-like permease n=1 Tax=Glaciibacter psychrotolerans TaxID=670054 RepID=A0A7Z0J7H7_9MICO|nr:drug/metabolite transporter (DMT)-like permease [Leifsonia psychrotolerans]